MRLHPPPDSEAVREALEATRDEAHRLSTMLASGALMIFLLGCFLPGAVSCPGWSIPEAPARLAKLVIQVSIGQ